MKKIKMIFPDGSIEDVDEADVATAQSLGAVKKKEVGSLVLVGTKASQIGGIAGSFNDLIEENKDQTPVLKKLSAVAQQQQDDEVAALKTIMPALPQADQDDYISKMMSEEISRKVEAGDADAISQVAGKEILKLKRAKNTLSEQLTGELRNFSESHIRPGTFELQDKIKQIEVQEQEAAKTGVSAINKVYADKFNSSPDQSRDVKKKLGSELRDHLSKMGVDFAYLDEKQKIAANPDIAMQEAGFSQPASDYPTYSKDKVKQYYKKGEEFDYHNELALNNALYEQKYNEYKEVLNTPELKSYTSAKKEEQANLIKIPAIASVIAKAVSLEEQMAQSVLDSDDMLDDYPQVRDDVQAAEVSNLWANYIRSAEKGELGLAEGIKQSRDFLSGRKLNTPEEVNAVVELSKKTDHPLNEFEVKQWAGQARVPSFIGDFIRGFQGGFQSLEQGVNRIVEDKTSADISNLVIESKKYHKPEAFHKNDNLNNIMSNMFGGAGNMTALAVQMWGAGEVIGGVTGLSLLGDIATTDLAALKTAAQIAPKNQLAKLIVAAGGTGTEEEALGLIIKSAEKAKHIGATAASIGIPSYEAAYQEAGKMTNDESKREEYARNMANANILGMLILNPQKLVGKGIIGRPSEKVVVDWLKTDVKFGAKDVFKSRLNEIIKPILAAVPAVGIPLVQETISKEKMFDIHTNGEQFFNEFLTRAGDMALSTIPFGVLGAAKVPTSSLFKQNLYQVGLRPDKITSSIEELYNNGGISSVAERDRQVSVINTLSGLVKTTPDRNSVGRELSQAEKNDLVYLQLQNSILRQKQKGASDELKPSYEKDITENQSSIDKIMSQEVLPETKKTGEATLKKPTLNQAELDAKWRLDISMAKTEKEKEAIDEKHAQDVAALGKSTEKIFTDFDGTVFKDGKLTPLGEQFKNKVAAGEDITVLTAREDTPENKKFIAEQLGIPEDNIKAGLSPEGKQAELAAETGAKVFYDNNPDNIKTAEGTLARIVNTGDQLAEKIDANKTNNIEADKVLRNEMLDNAKDIVLKSDIKGFSAEPLKDAAANDPEKFEKFLSNIAEQAHDPKSADNTIDTYGKELVDVAKELFPAEAAQQELTPEDIHAAADAKGIKWDNDAVFMDKSEKLTGERELSKMKPEQLAVMMEYVKSSPEANVKEIKIGITNAVTVEQLDGIKDTLPKEEYDRLKSIADKLSEGKKLEEAGDTDGAAKIYDEVLSGSQKQVADLFSDLPEIEVTVNRSKGNYFGSTEPIFEYSIKDSDTHLGEIIERMADVANNKFRQDAVHVSEILPSQEPPDGALFGVQQPDMSVYEPNIEIRTDKEMSEKDMAEIEKIIQENGLAGSTRFSDKKGLFLYNISNFKDYGEFINQTNKAFEWLHGQGFRFQVERNTRKLWNIGKSEGEGFVSYGQAKGLRDQLSPRSKEGVVPKVRDETTPEEAPAQNLSDADKFNQSVDAGVQAILNSKIVKALSAKLPPGTRTSGLSVEAIVKAGGEVIKKTYKAVKDIEKAVNAGIAHIKKLWEANFKGQDFPEEGLREMLTKQLTSGVSREDKKIINDAHAQLTDGAKESDVIKDLMSKYAVTKDEAKVYVDKANEIIEPPSTSKGAATDFVPIHREAQTEGDKLKENYTFGEAKGWGESVDAGLDKLAKVATKEGISLYEAANNQIHKWVANISKTKGAKALFNPNDEQIAQMAYHRAETMRRKNELSSQMNSPLLIDKTGALASLEILENNLENVDYVLNRTGEAAGRAFNIRQLVGKMNAKSGFEYRRMDLIKDNAGEPLTEKQQAELTAIHNEEQALHKKMEGLDEEKFKEEELKRRVDEEVANRLRVGSGKSNAISRGKLSVETADKISKNLNALADAIEKFGRAKGTEGASRQGIDIQKKIADAIRYVAQRIKDGKISDTVAQAIEKFAGVGDKKNQEIEDGIIETLKQAGLGKHIISARKEALDKIKAISEEEKSTDLTKSAVGKNLINDLFNAAIDDELKGDDVLSKVHDDLKTLFPDITRQQVRDAFLKEGEFKLERKTDIDNENKKAKLEVRSISKLETDLEDLKAENELRKRHEASKRTPSPEEQKLINERDDLLKKKDATEAEKKRFTELGKELDRLRSRQEKERQAKPEPKIIDRSDREKELLTDIEQEKKSWDKEKQDLKDTQKETERLIAERKKEEARKQSLIEKRDKLLQGIREPGKTNTPKIESSDIEKLKQDIAEADKRLREIENKHSASIREAKKLKDSIAEREQRLNDLKNRGEVWKKRKSKTTKQINSEIAAKNKEIEAELNKQGITLERGSKEEVAIKAKMAHNHNERTDDILKEIEDRMIMAEFGSDEHEALRQARNMLLDSKIESDTVQEVFNAIDKSKRFTELAKTELSNHPEFSDIVDQINNSQKQLSTDEYNTTQEVMLQKNKKSLQTKIKQTQKKIDRGEFVETKTSALDKLDAETVRLEIEQRKIDAKYRKLGEEARLKQRSFGRRLADDFQLVYLAQLIGGIVTEVKVAASGVIKQPLETATRATTGQLASTIFPSLKKAAGAEGFSLRQEAHRYMAGWGAISAEGMRKRVEGGQLKLDNADRNYDNVRDHAEQIKTNFGEDSQEYKNFIKNELTKAANTQQRATLDHFSNALYKWIGSNSWRDAADVFLHSTSRIEELMGFATKDEFGKMSTGDKIRFVIGSMGATHAVLKNFSARGEFAASFVARLESKVRKGVDIRNADEILKTVNESFVNYQMGKYQEDSFVTDAFKAATNAVEKLGEKNTKYKDYAWWTTTGARAKNPILRTPINITKDAILEYTFGLPRAMFLHGGEAYKGLRDAIGDGTPMNELYSKMKEAISNMDADKADLILRCYRKGGFAVGMYALAAMGVIGFGGFFNQDEKGHKNQHVNEVYIGGEKVPKIVAKVILHTPLSMPALLFSNYQRVLEKEKKMGATKWEANVEAIKGDLEAMKDEIPLFKDFSIQNQVKRFTLPFGRVAMDISEMFDVDSHGKLTERKPYNFMDEIQIRTGFRAYVPTKQEYQKMKSEDKRKK